MEARVSHLRFYQGCPVWKDQNFDRVVTVASNYNSTTGKLIYGAVVFKKDSRRDQWLKKLHRELALRRFFHDSVTINLSNHSGEELSLFAIDWYIAEELIFKYKASCQVDNKVIHKVNIYPGFNKMFDNMFSHKKPSIVNVEDTDKNSGAEPLQKKVKTEKQPVSYGGEQWSCDCKDCQDCQWSRALLLGTSFGMGLVIVPLLFRWVFF